jgi:hypothetical protein
VDEFDQTIVDILLRERVIDGKYNASPLELAILGQAGQRKHQIHSSGLHIRA